MANTAIQVTRQFHKEVEEVSKPKVNGQVVRRLQAMFAPVIQVRLAKSVFPHGLSEAAPKQVVKSRLKVAGKKKKKA